MKLFNFIRKERDLSEEVEEGGSKKRELSGFWKKYVYVVGLVMALFHIYVLVFAPIAHWNLYSIHILFSFLLVFPLYRSSTGSKGTVPWYDVILLILGVFAVGYCLVEARGMAYRMGAAPTTLDLVAIGIIIALLLEGTRRIYGMILPSIALLFLIYCLIGNHIPGVLGHRGYSLSKTIVNANLKL